MRSLYKPKFMWSLLTLAALVLLLPTRISLGQTPMPTPVVSKADASCSNLVNPLFDWLSQPKKGTTENVLDVMMTYHRKAVDQSSNGMNGTVIVARGILHNMKDAGPPRADGDLTTQYLAGSSNFSNTSFKLSIFAVSGFTSLQRKIDGKNFLGRPALAFSPNCTKDLMTTIVNGEVYTFTFRQSTETQIN